MKLVLVAMVLAGCDVVLGLDGRAPDASTIDAPPPCGSPDRQRNPAGCACETITAVQNCYLGDPGSTSACRVPGQVTCGPDHIWSECANASMPVQEVCFDMLDNDCDGVVDNGCSCANGDNLCLDPLTGIPFVNDHLWPVPPMIRHGDPLTVFGVSASPIPDPAFDVSPSGYCTGGVAPCNVGGMCAGRVAVELTGVPTTTQWFSTLGANRVRILRNSGPQHGNGSPCNPVVTAGAITGTVTVLP